jgi:hypothetical protein
VGTAEVIALIKHTIDISNLRDSPLFIALLDVEAAYDSIPHEAIYEGLTSLKAPERFIDILKGLEKHRELKIDTPFGLTEPFTALLGLAQGSILAPYYGRYSMIPS